MYDKRPSNKFRWSLFYAVAKDSERRNLHNGEERAPT